MASAQLSAKGDDIFPKDVMQQLESEGNDVQIECGSATFHFNKCYLCASSPKFTQMFEASKESKIAIPDVPPHIFTKMMQYMKHAKLDTLDIDSAPEVYKAASTYEVKRLKSLCASFMKNNITESTVCSFLSAVAKCNDKNSSEDERLIEAIKTFISNNEEFLTTNTWMSFSDKFPEAAELIK